MENGSHAKVATPGLRRCALAILALAAGLSIAGCSGGSLEIVELNYKRINPREPLIRHLQIQNAWWWVEENRLYVALEEEGGGLLGKLHKHSMELSLEFQGLPASTARDYQVDRATMRAYTHSGAVHDRFASERGIAGLWFEPGGILRGRFRLSARRQTFNILTGWSKAGNAIFVGEFQANENGPKGRSILESTEEPGMERYSPRGERRSGKPVRVEGPPVNRDQK